MSFGDKLLHHQQQSLMRARLAVLEKRVSASLWTNDEHDGEATLLGPDDETLGHMGPDAAEMVCILRNNYRAWLTYMDELENSVAWLTTMASKMQKQLDRKDDYEI